MSPGDSNAGKGERDGGSRGDLRGGLWRLADPKISLASFAGLFLGACLAARDGALAPGWLALTVAGIFFIEVAKNASGEIFDFRSGADLAVQEGDRSPFSGGKRVLVEGLLKERETFGIAALAYALGALCGMVIVIFREPRVLPLGLAGMALAFFYHAPPFRLSYRGWGEAAVGVTYGPLIVSGAYWVQRGDVTPEVVLASLPLGLLIAGFLWLNEFPDYRSDLQAGKRNGVVRLGRLRARWGYPLLALASGVLLALLPIAAIPRGMLLGLVGLVPGVQAARGILRSPESTPGIIAAQQMGLLAFLLAALGSGVGALLSA